MMSIEDNSQVSMEEKARESTEPRRVVDPYLITFEGLTDPLNPQNWPRRRKWLQIAMMSAMTLLV